MGAFGVDQEITHIATKEDDTRDERGLMSLAFPRGILEQLLFLNTYAIEEMRVDDDTLALKVRRTTPAKAMSSDRWIAWDYQLQAPNHGVLQYHLTDLPKDPPKDTETE